MHVFMSVQSQMKREEEKERKRREREKERKRKRGKREREGHFEWNTDLIETKKLENNTCQVAQDLHNGEAQHEL